MTSVHMHAFLDFPIRYSTQYFSKLLLHNHQQNNGQRQEMNESCCNDKFGRVGDQTSNMLFSSSCTLLSYRGTAFHY